ncbi:MAG: TonB-dependent receptor family protein [Bacteroidales bacterium]|nr:TonB-dependent receptor family protein [Bacteroidales bacterium]
MLFTSVFSVPAQTAIVKSTLKDSRTGEPVMFANVALLRPSDSSFVRGTTSDANGAFSLSSDGGALLRVSAIGYKTLWLKADSLQGETPMKPEATTLSEVTVVAAKPLYVMDGEKNLYNANEDPSVQTGTASDVLQNAPGVEVDAEGNITLRGTSSVEIWINDRPSHMNEEALKQYIKTLPANAIDRVEVITNPSARYSAAGGVINIVTNRKVTRNELLCVGLKGATTPSFGPWVSYVWANEKADYNIYIGGYSGNHDMASNGTSTLFDDNGDTSRYMKYDNMNKMPYQGGYLGFNTNWKIDDRTTLAAWAGAYPYWDQNSFFNNYEYTEYSPTRSNLGYRDTTHNNGFSHGAYAGAWLERRYDTTGRKLSFTFNGNYWANGGYSDNTRDYTSATLTDFKRHMEGDMLNGSGQLGLNYTLPLKHNYTIEAGAEFGYDYSRNSEVRDSLLPSGDWSNMRHQSYQSHGTSIEPSAYLTVQKRWGGFTTKLGLRYYNNFKSGWMEHPALSDRVSIDTLFSGLIPSIHLSYQTKTFESYSLSYTRRFAHEGDLSSYMPFRIYDDFSFSTGNPNLLMSYTHNLEAAFNKYVMGFGNIGLNAYIRANTNEIGTVTATNTDPLIGPYLVNYTFPDNIGSSHTEGIEANITYRPTGFFSVRFNATLFNYGYSYDKVDTNGLSYSFRLNVWAKVWNKLEIFANGSYSSPRLGLYSLNNASKRFDFGCSSDFFDRKLSIYLNISDIFGWSEWGSNTTAPQYKTTGKTLFNSQFVSLGITWRIGKMELESKARQGATDGQMPNIQ